MTDASGSRRCAPGLLWADSRLRAVCSVATVGVVASAFAMVPTGVRSVHIDVRAVSAAPLELLSAQWDTFDQFVARHAGLVATGAVAPGGGTVTGTTTSAATPMPLVATPTPLAATPTPVAASLQPAGAISDIESAIVSALSNAFLTLAAPLVSTPELAAIFGPFVFAGIIFYGLFVGVPLTIFNTIFAPVFSLLPFAAVAVSPAATTLAPTAAVLDVGPTATTDVMQPPKKPTQPHKAAGVTPTAAIADMDPTPGEGKSKGRQAPKPVASLDTSTEGQSSPKQGAPSGDPGAKSGATKPGAAKGQGKSLSHNSKSTHGNQSGNGSQSGNGNKGDS